MSKLSCLVLGLLIGASFSLGEAGVSPQAPVRLRTVFTGECLKTRKMMLERVECYVTTDEEEEPVHCHEVEVYVVGR